MVAASAALTLSGAPFMGPIGAARVGFINNEYVLNPQLDEMAESQLDLVVAGTQDAVLMVESEAKELTEEVMLGAVMFGHRHFQPVIDAIIRLAEKAAKEPRELTWRTARRSRSEMLGLIEQRSARGLRDPVKGGAPQGGRRRQGQGDGALLPGRRGEPALSEAAGRQRLQEARSQDRALEHPRYQASASMAATSKTVRPIVSEVGVLPRAHGSALFTRGETQALVVATLGTGEDEQ